MEVSMNEYLELDFRIEWGFRMVYARRMYHDTFDWSGNLGCSDDQAEYRIYSLHYPPCMWGIIYEPDSETEEPAHYFHNVLRRDIGGIRVCGKCRADSIFTLNNRYGKFVFSVRDLQAKGRIVFSVGPKYGFYSLIVTRKNYEYFTLPPRKNEVISNPADWHLPEKQTIRRARMYTLEPGQEIRLPLTVPPRQKAGSRLEVLCHFTGMPLLDLDSTLPPPPPERQERDMNFHHIGTPGAPVDACSGIITFELGFAEESTCRKSHYFRFHDFEIQMREDVWCRIPAEPGTKTFILKNCHPQLQFHLSTLDWEFEERTDLELQLPHWAKTDEKVFGRFYLFTERDITVIHGPGRQSFTLTGHPGWNELAIVPAGLGRQNYPVTISDRNGNTASGTIAETYDLGQEEFPLMVGADLTTVPHDDLGDMDYLLDYLVRTQLGNTVLFRSFHPFPLSEFHPSDECLERWGKFCREHSVYVQSVNCHSSGALLKGAREFLHNSGLHEYSGLVYAVDPRPGEAGSTSMKEAEQKFLDYISADAKTDAGRRGRIGYGEASGAARYVLKGGAEFLRAETMVGHTNMLCSMVRSASEVFSRGDWGTHIAIQHVFQPYVTATHLSLYYLALAMPWAMGCNDIYEEDSLFLVYKERLQSWRDAIPKLQREMTRDFFRFASLHPRASRPDISIAVLEGRYAAPFNGFVCGPEQTPSYSVWGGCGSENPAWGHLQPEKGRQLLDVLAPGAATLPLMQDPSKRRFFFSGTPFGDFDLVPVEANADYFSRYRLLLNLGWHSSNQEDLAKIQKFVSGGGTYFAGLPEYSRHTERDFLLEMKELNLENNGDLQDFCGLKVLGRSEISFSGRTIPELPAPETSRRYSFSADEDGECYYANIELTPDTEIVLKDEANGRPLVIRHRYGQGMVYTLCVYAYPGHEKLSRVMAGLLARLAAEHQGDIRLKDYDDTIFWNVRQEKFGQTAMLLNTDWTVAGNVRNCTLCAAGTEASLSVQEGQICLVTILNGQILRGDYLWHIKAVSPDEVVIYGSCDGELQIWGSQGLRTREIHFGNATAVKVRI